MTDRAHRFTRAFKVTDAARHDGAQFEDLARTDILATGVWADTASRSRADEAWLARHGLAGATIKIGLASIAYNMRRFVFRRRQAMAIA